MVNVGGYPRVIIIGAGPTGLSLAAQLIRYNIDFIILEKNERTTPFSKALVVQARTLEIFKEIGIAGKAIEEGKFTTALNLFYNGKKRVSVDIAGLGNGISEFPFALSLEQSKTEKLLVDHLSENGKTIHWKCEFGHFEQNDQGVRVYYKDGEGQQQVIEGAYVVGCDGAHSLIRHQSGMTFEGDTVPRIFYVADVILNSSVINKNELFIFLIKKGFILFFPMEGTGHYRVIGILPDKTEEDEFTFDDVEMFIKDQVKVPLEFKELIWFSSYKIHSRKANSFRNKRCFIAGDAAHIHTPAGGQGMNTGIQDAYNLAWKLAYTINEKVNDSVLESYNTERMENAKHLLTTTDRMFDIMAGSNMMWDFLRLKIFPSIIRFVAKNSMFNKRIFPLISQTGIAYPNSTLTITSKIGKVKAGDRIPYFVFADGKNIFDHLMEPVFKILFFGNGNHDPELRSNFRVASLSFNEIPKSIFGDASDFYVLLRPDNHISYIGDLDGCGNALKRITG